MVTGSPAPVTKGLPPWGEESGPVGPVTFNFQKPLVRRASPSTGLASGFTTIEKLCVALNGGVPLSVTFRVVRLVVFACATAGRHVKIPLFAFNTAPVGAVSRLNVSVCAGVSESVATLVIVSVTPALTTRLETGDNIGGVFVTVTTNVTFVLCVCPPLMPLMVTVFVPAGVEPEVVIVSVEVPEPLNDVGLKPAIVPAGRPLAVKATLALKLLVAVTVTVKLLVAPDLEVGFGRWMALWCWSSKAPCRSCRCRRRALRCGWR